MGIVVWPSRYIWGRGSARSEAHRVLSRTDPDHDDYWEWRMERMLEDTPQIRAAFAAWKKRRGK